MAPKLPFNKFLHELRTEAPHSLLILSIGNPPKYDRTRHNAGHRVAERVSESVGGLESPILDSPSVRVSPLTAAADRIYWAHSKEYMNLSGRAAVAAIQAVRSPYQLIVMHDDMDVALGDIKFKLSSRSFGGHNGLRDIAARCGAFSRIRIGIGEPRERSESAVTKYVMGRCPRSELETLDTVSVSHVAQLITQIIDASRSKKQRPVDSDGGEKLKRFKSA